MFYEGVSDSDIKGWVLIMTVKLFSVRNPLLCPLGLPQGIHIYY